MRLLEDRDFGSLYAEGSSIGVLSLPRLLAQLASSARVIGIGELGRYQPLKLPAQSSIRVRSQEEDWHGSFCYNGEIRAIRKRRCRRPTAPQPVNLIS